jgi:hypothetical protein
MIRFPNAAIREDGDSGELQDWLVDESPNQETALAASGDYSSHQSIGAPRFKEFTKSDGSRRRALLR